MRYRPVGFSSGTSGGDFVKGHSKIRIDVLVIPLTGPVAWNLHGIPGAVVIRWVGEFPGCFFRAFQQPETPASVQGSNEGGLFRIEAARGGFIRKREQGCAPRKSVPFREFRLLPPVFR